MEFNATFIVAAISFTVFTFIMNAIFYRPLTRIVTERQKFIEEHNEEAKHHSAKAQAILKDKDKKVEQTKQDSKKIIADKTNEVKDQKANLASEAQQKAANEVNIAKEDLHKSKDEAQNVLSENVISLAQDITAKIFGNDFQIKNANKELISKVMKEG